MIVDVGMMAVFLAAGLAAFRHSEQRTPLWRRILKQVIILALTALISYFFGRTGVIIAIGVALLPVIYIHAIWLPRHGVNGWTGEPKKRYYELRGWAWKEE